MAKPVKRDSQKGRVLAVLLDGRPHTIADFGPDAYTARNRIGELEREHGLKIERFPRYTGTLMGYRFAGPRPVVWAR